MTSSGGSLIGCRRRAEPAPALRAPESGAGPTPLAKQADRVPDPACKPGGLLFKQQTPQKEILLSDKDRSVLFNQPTKRLVSCADLNWCAGGQLVTSSFSLLS